MTSQPGIFALGTTDHLYLEFDLASPEQAEEALAAAVGVVTELSTTGGVNVVIGVRPSLWAVVADAGDVPGMRATGPTPWSGPTASPCPRPSTTCGCGSRPAIAPPSSTPGGWPSAPSLSPAPPSPPRRPDGCTGTTVTSPGSSTAPRTRPSSRRRRSWVCPTACRARGRAWSCTSSGGTTPRAGRRRASRRSSGRWAHQGRQRELDPSPTTRTSPARCSWSTGGARHLPPQRRLRGRRRPRHRLRRLQPGPVAPGGDAAPDGGGGGRRPLRPHPLRDAADGGLLRVPVGRGARAARAGGELTPSPAGQAEALRCRHGRGERAAPPRPVPRARRRLRRRPDARRPRGPPPRRRGRRGRRPRGRTGLLVVGADVSPPPSWPGRPPWPCGSGRTPAARARGRPWPGSRPLTAALGVAGVATALRVVATGAAWVSLELPLVVVVAAALPRRRALTAAVAAVAPAAGAVAVIVAQVCATASDLLAHPAAAAVVRGLRGRARVAPPGARARPSGCPRRAGGARSPSATPSPGP